MSTPWEVIIGPPGCGKTTALMAEVRGELAAGRPEDEIAAVTFTKAGAREIVQRIGRELDRPGLALPYARTIHSLAYRQIRVQRGQIMSARHWKAFEERYSYRFSAMDDGDAEEHPLEPPTRTEDDQLRHAYEWGRSRCFDLEETELRYDPPLRSDQFRLYVQRYEEFKVHEELRDFSDLLIDALGSSRPPVKVAFIDEAQDLSPAQIRCCQHWFANCERVVVVGDADQAIFEFQGANPEWLTKLARETTPKILEQSYRVPAEPHALARAVITRNRDRLDARYEPRPAMGQVEPMSLRLALKRLTPDVKTFILVRNRKFLKDPAEHCLKAGFPYLVEGNGGPSPYRREKLVKSMRVAIRLHEGDSCTAAELKRLLDFVPSRGEPKLLEHGTKTVVKNTHGATRWTPAEISKLGAGALIALITKEGPLAAFRKDVKASELEYFGALLKRYKDIPEPPIVLTTIHGSKGREADRVIVLPDMARATWKEYQTREGEAAENRVFYVAATRTRNELWLTLRESDQYYRWPQYQKPPAPAPPPPVAIESIDDLDPDLTFVSPATQAPWRVVEIAGVDNYWVVARTERERPAAREDVPHLVCLTEDELTLLEGLELEPDLLFRIHAHLTAFPNWAVRRCIASNVPNWESRLERRRGRSHGRIHRAVPT